MSKRWQLELSVVQTELKNIIAMSENIQQRDPEEGKEEKQDEDYVITGAKEEKEERYYVVRGADRSMIKRRKAVFVLKDDVAAAVNLPKMQAEKKEQK